MAVATLELCRPQVDDDCKPMVLGCALSLHAQETACSGSFSCHRSEQWARSKNWGASCACLGRSVYAGLLHGRLSAVQPVLLCLIWTQMWGLMVCHLPDLLPSCGRCLQEGNRPLFLEHTVMSPGLQLRTRTVPGATQFGSTWVAKSSPWSTTKQPLLQATVMNRLQVQVTAANQQHMRINQCHSIVPRPEHPI